MLLIADPASPLAVAKRKYSQAERAKAHTMPGGRYPIETPKDVENAVDDYNRTGQSPAVRAHIMTEAKRIGALDRLPDGWNVRKELADLRKSVEDAISKLGGEVVVADTAVIKANDEQRYTFGPLYTPGELDAHNEFARSGPLQKAVWRYAQQGDRKLRKQHDKDISVGDVVELVTWPYPAEVELALPGGEVRKAMLPAGTAYMGTLWSEEAWPLVKSGAITGYSLGGRAIRVRGLSEEGFERMRKDGNPEDGVATAPAD